MVYLLTVLLKHPELKALVQLVLLDGPELDAEGPHHQHCPAGAMGDEPWNASSVVATG